MEFHLRRQGIVIYGDTSRSGATRRNGSTDVTPVKGIYLLNVVVKQKKLIKTGKQNRKRLVVLYATEFLQGVTRYCIFIHVQRTIIHRKNT